MLVYLCLRCNMRGVAACTASSGTSCNEFSCIYVCSLGICIPDDCGVPRCHHTTVSLLPCANMTGSRTLKAWEALLRTYVAASEVLFRDSDRSATDNRRNEGEDEGQRLTGHCLLFHNCR
jgi:hypothetical protein